MTVWTIHKGYGDFKPVEFVRETPNFIVCIDRLWSRTTERRGSKKDFLPWRGTEEDARRLAEKLTSARAEYDRRANAARAWLKERQAELIAEFTEPTA